MKRFKKVYIEITSACNLKCDFCPQTKRKAEFMDLQFFNHILKEVSNFSDYIYLHVKGEPLLHPDLEKFLNLAGEYNLKVNITTNGTLIKKAESKLLNVPSLRQINFSLHSFDANTPLCSIDEYIGDIFSFIDKAKEASNIIISLRLWNLEEAALKARDNSDSAYAEKNRHILEKIETFFNLDYKIEETLKTNRGIKLAPNIYLNQALRFEWPDLNIEEVQDKGFCYGLKDQLAILVDGTVVPCCLDGEGIISLGNIKNSALEDIIAGQRAKAIYEGFSKREVVEELCQKCGYRKRFGLK